MKFQAVHKFECLQMTVKFQAVHTFECFQMGAQLQVLATLPLDSLFNRIQNEKYRDALDTCFCPCHKSPPLN